MMLQTALGKEAQKLNFELEAIREKIERAKDMLRAQMEEDLAPHREEEREIEEKMFNLASRQRNEIAEKLIECMPEDSCLFSIRLEESSVKLQFLNEAFMFSAAIRKSVQEEDPNYRYETELFANNEFPFLLNWHMGLFDWKEAKSDKLGAEIAEKLKSVAARMLSVSESDILLQKQEYMPWSKERGLSPRGLPGRMKQVAKAYIEGTRKWQEIADALGVSKKAVDNDIQRVKLYAGTPQL